MHAQRKTRESGTSLTELLVAMLVLSTGMAAIFPLFAMSVMTDTRSGRDTAATMLAKMVAEQISAQHTNSNASVVLTDCAGNNWTVATAPGASPNGAGANLDQSSTSSTYGMIDQTQAYNAITANYAMKYTDCGNPATPGQQVTYDVRWNVMVVSPNLTRMITVSARPYGYASNKFGGAFLNAPVTLRTITGP